MLVNTDSIKKYSQTHSASIGLVYKTYTKNILKYSNKEIKYRWHAKRHVQIIKCLDKIHCYLISF